MPSHFEIHVLERKIAAVITKGFSPKMDKADAIQAGHDVADMLLGEYFVDVKPTDIPDRSLSKALESTAFGLEGLAKALNGWVMGKEFIQRNSDGKDINGESVDSLGGQS